MIIGLVLNKDFGECTSWTYRGVTFADWQVENKVLLLASCGALHVFASLRVHAHER